MPRLSLLLTLAALFASAAPGQVAPTDAELQTLITYGQSWRSPDRLYQDALPYSTITRLTDMRKIRFMTDDANICLEACRAKLLLQKFGLPEARALYKANRIQAVLEVDSATVIGAQSAREDYGKRDINLVLLDGENLLQPSFIGSPSSETGAGLAMGTITRAGNVAFVNTIGLVAGILTRSFSFDLPVLPQTARFILIRSDGKKQRFTASLADLSPNLEDDFQILLQYTPSAAVPSGQDAQLRFSMRDGRGKPISRPLIIRADSIWRQPITVTGRPSKVADLPATSLFSYRRDAETAIYSLALPTAGLEACPYSLQIRVGGHIKALSFSVK